MKTIRIYLLLCLVLCTSIFTPEAVSASQVQSESIDLEQSIPQNISVSYSEYAPLIEPLREGMQNRNHTIHLIHTGSFSTALPAAQAALKEVLKDDEYLAYDYTGMHLNASGRDGRTEITLDVRYIQNRQQVHYVEQQIPSIIEEIIEPWMDDHDKVRAVNDYVVLRLEYDTSMNQGVNAPYFALTGGKTLCNGYAMLTYLLLEELDIPVRLISGFAGENHAWNLVEVDGHWYHLDTTWNDPVPDVKGRVRYDYYLLTDEEMSRSRTWENGGLNGWDRPYPKATTSYREQLKKSGRDDLLQILGLEEKTVLTGEALKRTVHEQWNVGKSAKAVTRATSRNQLVEQIRSLVQSYGYVGTYTYSQKVIATNTYEFEVTLNNYTPKKMTYPMAGIQPIGDVTTADPKKRWTIYLNETLATNPDVKVMDQYGKNIPIQRIVQGSSIRIFPAQSWESGMTYYIVGKNIESVNKQRLADFSIRFKVQ